MEVFKTKLKTLLFNSFNTRDWYTGLIMVILRKGPELLGVERVKEYYKKKGVCG